MSEHPGKAAIGRLMVNQTTTRADYEAIASHVSDLEARLEKAEAERDEWGKAAGEWAEVASAENVRKLKAAARNDALEEAISAVDALLPFEANTGERQRFQRRDIETFRKGALRLAIEDITALKDKS